MRIENKTPTDYTGPQEPEEEPEGYYEATTVNGVEISVGWDIGYKEYTIYFPQIDAESELREEGVSDQVIRLSRRRDVAKQVAGYAVQLAQTEPNVYEIYRKVAKFSRDLVYNEDKSKETSPISPVTEARKEQGPDKSYRETTTVNGVEISVGWDDFYKDYTIYFSPTGEGSSEEDAYSQAIRLTRLPKIAKQVFDYAVVRAQLNPDPEDISRKVEEYSRDLPYK